MPKLAALRSRALPLKPGISIAARRVIGHVSKFMNGATFSLKGCTRLQLYILEQSIQHFPDFLQHQRADRGSFH